MRGDMDVYDHDAEAVISLGAPNSPPPPSLG